MPEELTEAQRSDLIASLQQLERSLVVVLADHRTATVELDQGAVGRISRVDALQAQQMAAEEKRRAEQRLKVVHRALARVAEDPEDYGWCPDCGEPVGYGRLQALPEAVFCVACTARRGG